MTQTVLITGASGNIGRKLSVSLGKRFDLKLLDLRGTDNVVSADLTCFSHDWVGFFEGVDTVIHLAGEMRPNASWDSCYSGNVVSTRNVLTASRQASVKRVIFASSNQIMAGYRFLEGPVFSDSEPKPLNPYAVSKLICEEVGKSFARDTGISFIALRIGYMQSGDNVPGSAMGIGLWGQQMWLSDRDALLAFEHAIAVRDVSVAVLNLVSDNVGMRWDMEKTKTVIGFVPRDGHSPALTVENQDEDDHAKLARVTPGYWLDQYFNVME